MMEKEMVDPSLTVVMPAYNEEDSIEAASNEVRTQVLDRVPRSSLLVVDDGSKDQTGEILDGIAARDSRITVLHQPNGGHGAAVIAGLNHATTDYVFLIDSDRQIPLDHFSDAWGLARDGKDGVFGVRRQRNDPRLRLILTAVVRRSLHL